MVRALSPEEKRARRSHRRKEAPGVQSTGREKTTPQRKKMRKPQLDQLVIGAMSGGQTGPNKGKKRVKEKPVDWARP